MRIKPSYTHLEDTPVVICNDCGAQAFSEDGVVHFESCIPGCSESWTDLYNDQPDEETEE